ncbi:MAG: hypothetical protein GXY44_00340 [Phycisphaerales bacterium]|nr:hypothetical protein [Phycisphaerales bacterium]
MDITQVHVPQDDGSLSRAIAELEAMLSAYSASLRTVHKRVRETGVVEAAAVEPAAVTIPAPMPSAEPQETASAPSVPEVEPIKPVIEEASTLCVEVVPPSPETSPVSAEENEEALLASLDAVTAERVRVLRRLCDRKKSVRELLSELETTKPSPPPAQAKKRSWFLKG